jgi:hypothetical protein
MRRRSTDIEAEVSAAAVDEATEEARRPRRCPTEHRETDVWADGGWAWRN